LFIRAVQDVSTTKVIQSRNQQLRILDGSEDVGICRGLLQGCAGVFIEYLQKTAENLG